MKSVADTLRARSRDEVRALAPAARIDLAFALGEEDLAAFMRVSGLHRVPSLDRLRAARRVGRRPSRCLETDAP